MLKNATGHAAYARETSRTASPAQIVLMCYQRILTACDRATEAAENRTDGWIQTFHDECIRAEMILTELIAMTDPESENRNAARMATELADLYLFTIDQFVAANVDKTIAPFDSIRDTIGELADGWMTVVQQVDA